MTNHISKSDSDVILEIMNTLAKEKYESTSERFKEFISYDHPFLALFNGLCNSLNYTRVLAPKYKKLEFLV